MSGLPHPTPHGVKVAALMAAAIGLGALGGAWYVVRARVDSVVDRWMKA